ncbi:flagellin [Lysinibacillus xylanilyticus]|uniref:flagellin n=1 Tax=Lysinibacillus xylanilyticus TaxID=582475 RepID=UPI003815292F
MGANENQHISIPLFSAKPDELGINNLGLLPPNTPDESLSKLDKGLEKITNIRSTYGAIQNRLEHAYNLVVNTSENLQAAESRIRDTDMAKEMMKFTKDNILIQAAQTMLAQSNKQPEVILQLLQ